MKRIIIGLVIFVCVVAFSGCAARINKQMASWEGQNYNELIASWGPPSQMMDSADGGKIIIYSKTKCWQQCSGGYCWTNCGNAYRMFWADPNGIIHRWQWKGL
jgi:hypothetical protein